MEVGDQEQAVVQYEVGRWYREQYPGHAADAEGDDEADSPQHGRGELDTTAVHGEQPVEDLHPGRDGDDHGSDAEEGIHVGTGAHGEEVVQPDDEGEHGNGDGRPHQRGVTEQLLLAEGSHHFGEDPEHRQHQNVHLGVTPGPDQVDVHHHVATHVIGKEMGAEVTVGSEQGHRDGQDREGGDDQDVGAQGGPGKHRQTHHGHARGTHLDDGGEEVDAGQQSAQPRDLQTPDPVVDPDPRAVFQPRQRRIGQPAGLGKLTNPEGDVDQHHGGGGEPEAHVVEEGEGHVTGADLQRHHNVHQTDHQRHRHEEDHDDAVGGEDLVVVMRWQNAVTAGRSHHLLGPHHHRIGEAAQQHHHAEDEIHDPEALVIHRGEPLFPQILPLAEIGDETGDGQPPQNDSGHRHHDDGFMVRNGVER